MPSAYLWCPAYALTDHAHLQRTRAAAATFAQSAGLDLHESPLLDHFQGPQAWLDRTQRTDDLRRGLAHDLLLAARGGYGCLDLIDSLRSDPPARPPLLLGYSDLTILHAWWFRNSFAETLYGFMPGVASGERSRSSSVALWHGQAMDWSSATCNEGRSLVAGSAEGRLFPACLRVLTGLVGTPAMPDLSGCLLALEDIDERPYRLDRDFTQLALSGALRGICGFVFAAFPAPDPTPHLGPGAEDICRAWAKRLRVPAIFAFPFGHHSDPITLPSGRRTTLRVGPEDWQLQVAARTA